MQLPDNPTMNETAHGHGRNGLAFYSYEDAQGLGILLDARRLSARQAFKDTWRYRWLPRREFASYSALHAAVAALSDEAIASEKAKWPQLIEPPDVSEGTNKCWLHSDLQATHHAHVQESWHEYDCSLALLCGNCAAAAATDPSVIARARAQRLVTVAARKAARESTGGPAV